MSMSLKQLECAYRELDEERTGPYRLQRHRVERMRQSCTDGTLPIVDATDEKHATYSDIDELMLLRSANYNLMQRVVALEGALREERSKVLPPADLSGASVVAFDDGTAVVDTDMIVTGEHRTREVDLRSRARGR